MQNHIENMVLSLTHGSETLDAEILNFACENRV